MVNKLMDVTIALVVGVVLIPVIIGVLSLSGLSETALAAFPGARSLLVIIPLAFIGGLLFFAMKTMRSGGGGKGGM